MPGQLNQLETKLNEVFTKSVPALPKNVKELIVQYLPYLSLLGAAISLWSAYNIWHWANQVNKLANWANEFSTSLGLDTVETTRWSVTLWISLIVLVIMGVLYLAAFSPLKARKKAGWNFLFYALILSVVYSLVGIFVDNYGGGFGGFLGSLIGFAIGGYFLFQIREYYLGKKIAPAPKTPVAAKANK